MIDVERRTVYMKNYRVRYREKNKERLAGQNAAWYENNKERVAARNLAYRGNNKSLVAAQKAASYKRNKPHYDAYRERNGERLAALQRGRLQSLRARFYDMYGFKKEGHEHGVCTCCKEADLMMFGTISHVDGGGADHRRVLSGGTRAGVIDRILKEAIAHYEPTRFAAECYNCNCAAQRNGGICPHKTKGGKT